MSYEVEIVEKTHITDKKAVIQLEKPADYYFKAGEHLKVKIDGHDAYYSIGSAPEDGVITLYVKKLKEGKFAEAFLNKEVNDTVEITDSDGDYVYSGEEKVLLLSTGMGAAPNLSIKKHIRLTRNKCQAGLTNICSDSSQSFCGNIGHQIYKDTYDDPVNEMLECIDGEEYDKIYFCGNEEVGEKVEKKAKEVGIPVESIKY